MTTRKLVGHVGVDSGQILITDPCYAIRRKGESQPTVFEERELDLSAICDATTGVSPGCAELGNEVAVVTCTAYGDGVFPVYAECDSDGLVHSITVDFDTQMIEFPITKEPVAQPTGP